MSGSSRSPTAGAPPAAAASMSSMRTRLSADWTASVTPRHARGMLLQRSLMLVVVLAYVASAWLALRAGVFGP